MDQVLQILVDDNAKVPTGLLEKGSPEELFLRVSEDDDYGAFEKLFKRLYAPLCTCAYRILNSKELTEEVVDDVFCSLWKNRKQIHISISLKAYLAASVKNKALDYLRSLKRSRNCDLSLAINLAGNHPSALDDMSYCDLDQAINQAIQSLPRQCRQIFQMSRDQGMKYKEIADTLQLSIKTVDTQMGRALKFLRNRLKPEGK